MSVNGSKGDINECKKSNENWTLAELSNLSKKDIHEPEGEEVPNKSSRGPGRPTLLRTGNRGRPKQIYKPQVQSLPELQNLENAGPGDKYSDDDNQRFSK